MLHNIVESGRLVVRQSAIHTQCCQRVNAILCDHVIAARSQQVFPEVNSVGTHSVGTVRAASNYNKLCRVCLFLVAVVLQVMQWMDVGLKECQFLCCSYRVAVSVTVTVTVTHSDGLEPFLRNVHPRSIS